jgi:hypothetical protein
MPKIDLNLDEESWSDCDCSDGISFPANVIGRKHIPAGDDVWCCVLIKGHSPRGIRPVSGAAKAAFDEVAEAKAAAEQAKVARKVVVDQLEVKRIELKAKVEGGGNLSNDDMKDLLTLWVQL